MSQTAGETIIRIRGLLRDDDPAHPVIDAVSMLRYLSDDYIKVAAVLGLKPASMTPACAGLAQVALSGVELQSLQEVLYSDGATHDKPLPKMSFEDVLRLRGGRELAELPSMRPRVFSARELTGHVVTLDFDTKCPADATLEVFRSVQASRLTKEEDVLHLSVTALTAVESMTACTCIYSLPPDKMQKLGLNPELASKLQQSVDLLLNEDRSRAASIELADTVVQTEN